MKRSRGLGESGFIGVLAVFFALAVALGILTVWVINHHQRPQSTLMEDLAREITNAPAHK
jgi:hypothetical protein